MVRVTLPSAASPALDLVFGAIMTVLMFCSEDVLVLETEQGHVEPC